MRTKPTDKIPNKLGALNTTGFVVNMWSVVSGTLNKAAFHVSVWALPGDISTATLGSQRQTCGHRAGAPVYTLWLGTQAFSHLGWVLTKFRSSGSLTWRSVCLPSCTCSCTRWSPVCPALSLTPQEAPASDLGAFRQDSGFASQTIYSIHWWPLAVYSISLPDYRCILFQIKVVF